VNNILKISIGIFINFVYWVIEKSSKFIPMLKNTSIHVLIYTYKRNILLRDISLFALLRKSNLNQSDPITQISFPSLTIFTKVTIKLVFFGYRKKISPLFHVLRPYIICDVYLWCNIDVYVYNSNIYNSFYDYLLIFSCILDACMYEYKIMILVMKLYANIASGWNSNLNLIIFLSIRLACFYNI